MPSRRGIRSAVPSIALGRAWARPRRMPSHARLPATVRHIARCPLPAVFVPSVPAADRGKCPPGLPPTPLPPASCRSRDPRMRGDRCRADGIGPEPCGGYGRAAAPGAYGLVAGDRVRCLAVGWRRDCIWPPAVLPGQRHARTRAALRRRGMACICAGCLALALFRHCSPDFACRHTAALPAVLNTRVGSGTRRRVKNLSGAGAPCRTRIARPRRPTMAVQNGAWPPQVGRGVWHMLLTMHRRMPMRRSLPRAVDQIAALSPTRLAAARFCLDANPTKLHRLVELVKAHVELVKKAVSAQ